MSSWWWPWPAGPVQPVTPENAVHNPILRAYFTSFLDNTEPPNSFKASQVAQSFSDQELASLGYEKWEDLMPAILLLAFEQREFGYCHIMQKGKVLGENVSMHEVVGGFRIRRVAGVSFVEVVSDDYRDRYLE